MAENSEVPPLTPAEEDNESAEIYSVSQDKNGTFHFSRRDFLLLGMAAGGALLAKGLCPRFGAGSASTKNQPIQSGMMPIPKVYLHSRPSIDSDIVDSLQQNDIVLLLGDHPETGWVEVATHSGKQGWLKRIFVDFTRAISGSSPNFNFNDVVSQKPTPKILSVQVSHKPALQRKNIRSGRTLVCGDAIQNGDFEAGHVNWIEESNHGTNVLITNTWSDPYQGSYVALLGGVDGALDKLTQVIHLPADVQDAQLFEFYLKMTTAETDPSVYDWLIFRLLDADGIAISDDILIADNTAPVLTWEYQSIQFISGFSTFAGQDIQVQFEGYTDSSNITDFIIDSVSFNLDCGSIPTPTDTPTQTPTQTSTPNSGLNLYVYLPIVMNDLNSGPTNTPTQTPTETPTSTPVPCNCDSLPTCSCNSGNPCTCNSNPCSCDIAIPNCSCNGYNPCSCDIAIPNCACHGYNPCSCDIAIPNCACHGYNPCSCDIAIPNCACHGYNPCTCNTAPCTCNIAPCSCNIAPCSCNIAPCSCNVSPCSCNISPCICNYNFCSCNLGTPCSFT